jgi:phosphatidylserine/phosphatidylglycerophosphate/cardiolipin synthase-like enzyme
MTEEHARFGPGPAAVEGLSVTPLVDAEAFESVYKDLLQARWRVYIATWSLEEKFVVHKDLGGELTLADLCKQALKEHPGLEIYVLVWDWNELELPALHGFKSIGSGQGLSPFTAAGMPGGGGFAGPDDERRLHIAAEGNKWYGSHHQKFVVCDLTGLGEAQPTASVHCLGLNFENRCRDGVDHPYPNENASGGWNWHDTGARIVGPLVRDFEVEFIRRWRDATGEELPANQFAGPPNGTTRGRALIHVEQTEEPSVIKRWYLEAIRGAQRFVYLENQFFDDADVARELWRAYLAAERRGAKVPMGVVLPWWDDLGVLVWPPWHPIGPWSRYNVTELRVRTAEEVKLRGRAEPLRRPSGGWPDVRVPPTPDELAQLAATGDPAWLDMLAGRPRRFAVLADGEWVEWKDVEWARGGIGFYRLMSSTGGRNDRVYVHSKLGLVDDAYTVGSSNTSYQSFVTDSEANVAIEGAAEVLAMGAKVWPPMVGLASGAAGDRTAEQWVEHIEAVAWRNRAQLEGGAATSGMVLPWEKWE